MSKASYRPISLADGVKQFLAATKDQHNGLTYKDLDAFMQHGCQTCHRKMSITDIGRAFNYKSWQAARDLIDAYKKELARPE